MPKTYHPPGGKCSGGKNSKAHVTGMVAASATGEKLPMFVIGKSKTLRRFKNIKLPNPKHYDALKILSKSLANIAARRKVE